ncbi:hypothetical protein [Geodermatophilus sp. URMC 63]
MTTADREDLLHDGLAALHELERRLGETRASLRTAEEVVVRQRELLETATELIEEARRWARSLWDDEPASEEPVILNEPELAPAWLTTDGPRHTRPPQRTQHKQPHGAGPGAAARGLRLAALRRALDDIQNAWGPLSAEDLHTAAEQLPNRG